MYQEAGQYNLVYLEYVYESEEIFKIVELVIGKTVVRSDLSKEVGKIKEIVICSDPAILMLMPGKFSYLEW